MDGEKELVQSIAKTVAAVSDLAAQLDRDSFGPLGDDQREAIRRLRAKIGALELLLGDGSLRARSAGEKASLDLHALVRDAVQPLLRQAGEMGVEVFLHTRPGVEVIGDRIELAWVVASLVGNALRYSPRGTSVMIMTTALDAHRVDLRVIDQGAGIPSHVLERLFDRTGGFGLTLVLVREIVEAHGGTISVRSDVGQGCKFVVVLPATHVGESVPPKGG